MPVTFPSPADPPSTRENVTVGAVPVQVVGPPESASLEVVPAAHWAEDERATPHPGAHDMDVVWAITGDDGPRVEAYEFDVDAPDRLRRWISLHDGGSLERRF